MGAYEIFLFVSMMVLLVAGESHCFYLLFFAISRSRRTKHAILQRYFYYQFDAVCVLFGCEIEKNPTDEKTTALFFL